MNCTPYSIELDQTFSGDTWDGFTWTVSDVSSDDTRFAGTLTQALMQITDSTGAAVLTLDSDVSGEITLNETTANAWSVTVEPRILTLGEGVYSWALRLFDDSIEGEQRKVTLSGTIPIIANPFS